jgi:myosin heavy subunit
MYKNIEEKATGLETQIDEVIRDANQEIKGLRERYQTIQKEQEIEKRKGHDIYEELKEKNRQLNKLQTVYDKMKAKSQREIARVKLSEGAQPPPRHQPQQRAQQPIHFPAPPTRRTSTPISHHHETAPRLDTQRFDTPRRFGASDGDQRKIPVMKQKSSRPIGYQGGGINSFTASSNQGNRRMSSHQQHPPGNTSGQALFAPRKGIGLCFLTISFFPSRLM